MTDAGKDRKKRMWTKLFHEKDELCLYSNMFLAVLPLFKSLMYVLEQKQIHKLYDTMTENMRFFFACFMKFEELDKVQSDKLNSINVSDLVRKKKYLFVGKCNDKFIKKLKTSPSGRELIVEFLNKLQKAYVDTASYLQTKYAINNKVLKYLSAIDTSARGHCLTHSYLKELYDYFAPFIKVVDGSDYGFIQRR